MKRIKEYIQEKLHINKNVKAYNYFPKTKDDLIECIKDKISKEGLGTETKPLDLNDIDTSKITDMSELFDSFDGTLKKLSENGYFDISDWNVSKVENMYYMFANSDFNGDVSKWDVSKVEDMSGMFEWSKFNGNISKWDVSNVRDMSYMFYKSEFTGENSNIDKWKINNKCYIYTMFINCPLETNPPKWWHEKPFS